MADPIVRLARRLDRASAPAVAAERWEIAEVLARVDAAIARRRAA